MEEITVYNKGADSTIISFSGVGHSEMQITEEFFNLTKEDYNVIFVKDLNRSWFNNINPNKIIDNIKTDKVYCVGNSMGSFNSVIFSSYYPVNKVIGFTPQYSVFPDIVPWENRYTEYVSKISSWTHKEMIFKKNTEYLFICGNAPFEKMHHDLIPSLSNIKKIMIRGDHKVSKNLKRKKILQNVIIDFIENNKINEGLKNWIV